MAVKLDLSNIPLEDLIEIQNQVLKRVAVEAKLKLDSDTVGLAHDSHGSNHSNNKIEARDLQEQIARLAKPKG